jgi:hypothetical protein
MKTNYSKAELDKLKDYAKVLYTRERLTQEEVSAKTGVHINTVKRWSVAGGWKKLQRNYSFSRDEQVGYMMDELAELNGSIRIKAAGKRFADSKEGDVRFKLVRHIKDLESDASVVEAINASAGLLNFVAKIDLLKAREITSLMDKYIKSMLHTAPKYRHAEIF